MALVKYNPNVKYTIFKCCYIDRLLDSDEDQEQEEKILENLSEYRPIFIVTDGKAIALTDIQIEDRAEDLDLLISKNFFNSKIIDGIIFESCVDPIEIYNVLRGAQFCEIYGIEKITYYQLEKIKNPFCCIIDIACESG